MTTDEQTRVTGHWRILDNGDTIREGDEWQDWFTGEWLPVTSGIGLAYGIKDRTTRPYRRFVIDLNEQEHDMDEELKRVAEWIDSVEAMAESYPDASMGDARKLADTLFEDIMIELRTVHRLRVKQEAARNVG